MNRYEIDVIYKVVRTVLVEANSKSEAREKARIHDVEDVNEDWDLGLVSVGKAELSFPIWVKFDSEGK